MGLLWGKRRNQSSEVKVGGGIGQGFSAPRRREELNVRLQQGSGAGAGLGPALGFTVHWASTMVPELL